MPLEVQPKGWYVQRTIRNDGTVIYNVLIDIRVGSGDPVPQRDLEIVVRPDIPWYLRWQGSFEKRMIRAASRAQRRAYDLNRALMAAHRITYRIENDPEMREAQANPHDTPAEAR